MEFETVRESMDRRKMNVLYSPVRVRGILRFLSKVFRGSETVRRTRHEVELREGTPRWFDHDFFLGISKRYLGQILSRENRSTRKSVVVHDSCAYIYIVMVMYALKH